MMTRTTVLVPAAHERRITIADAAALLDLASRAACALLIALDHLDHEPDNHAGDIIRHLARHPDVVTLRRRLDAGHAP